MGRTAGGVTVGEIVCRDDTENMPIDYHNISYAFSERCMVYDSRLFSFCFIDSLEALNQDTRSKSLVTACTKFYNNCYDILQVRIHSFDRKACSLSTTSFPKSAIAILFLKKKG